MQAIVIMKLDLLGGGMGYETPNPLPLCKSSGRFCIVPAQEAHILSQHDLSSVPWPMVVSP